MLRANCSKIDGVLLTHEHNDHTAGIDDIRPFYFKQGAISFFAQKQVFKNLHNDFLIFLKLNINTQVLQL